MKNLQSIHRICGIFTLLVLASFLSVTPRTFGAEDKASPKQQWDYKLVSESSLLAELMLKLKKEGVYDFTVSEDGQNYAIDFKAGVVLAPHIKPFFTERFNELGADGWQFSGCIGEKNDKYVFRRPR